MPKQNEKWPFIGKVGTVTALVIMSVLFVIAIFLTAQSGSPEQLGSLQSNVAMSCLGMLVLILMFASCVAITPEKSTALFILILAANFIYLFTDALRCLRNGDPDHRTLLLMENTVFYLFSMVQLWLFWQFIRCFVWDDTKVLDHVNLAIGILTAADILLILFNIPFGYLFIVNEAGQYVRTPTYYVSIICPAVVVTASIVAVVRQRNNLGEKLALLSYPVLPCLSGLLTVGNSSMSALAPLAFISVVFIYCNLFISHDRDRTKRQAELAQSEINAMTQQINPHFIYNTLGSAASLCTEDPERAQEMLYTFSSYLRNNFSEISGTPLIPFRKELEHLNSYITIEKMRFPDITVEIDARVTDFFIPGLSLQPLVENAITHGIMGRESGGSLRISTMEDALWYHIFVEDDGIGFTTTKKNDGRKHVGISNVRARLEMLCGGKLILNSTPGVGTIAEIRIPKGERQDAGTMR